MRTSTIRSVLRTLAGAVGYLLLIATLVLLGADLVASLDAGGPIVARTPADWWGVIVGTPVPDRWSPFLGAVSGLAAWVYPGLLGVILVFFFGPKRD